MTARPAETEPADVLEYARWIVRASAFARFIGLEVEELREGYCRTRLPSRPELLNQGGTIHGGVYAVAADHTAGTAASTSVREHERVVSAEYKLNLLRLGLCDALVTEGRVLKAGRRLVIGEADVFGEKDGGQTLLAKSLFTFAVIPRENAGAPADTPPCREN